MAVLQAHYMRIGHVGILVYFVGVVGRDTAFGGEGELGDDVHDLLLLNTTNRLFISFHALPGLRVDSGDCFCLLCRWKLIIISAIRFRRRL